jgi:arylsulfatase
MEVFAAALAYADFQIGRVIDELQAQGKLDNTLVIYIQGDNGGGMEGGREGLGFAPGTDMRTKLSEMHKLGGPEYNNMYPAGWGWATNSPFQWAKQVASHLGGIRNGMVISWPKQVAKPGGIRTQFHDVVDIAPTIYEAAGIVAPTSVNGVEQQPLDGVSMLYSLNAPAAGSHRTSQLFEMNGHAAFYANGWFASSKPRIEGEGGGPPAPVPASALGAWELYNLDKDFSQSTDLAARYPEKLKELQDQFWKEAAQGDVLPFVDKVDVQTTAAPTVTGGRTSFHFRPTPQRIYGGVLPGPGTTSWHLTAKITSPKQAPANGTIVMGGNFDLAIEGGVPRVSYKVANTVVRIKGGTLQPTGDNRVEIKFTPAPTGKPDLELVVNGRSVGHASPPPVRSSIFSRFGGGGSASVGWGFDVIDPQAPAPASFNGTIDDVAIDLNK